MCAFNLFRSFKFVQQLLKNAGLLLSASHHDALIHGLRLVLRLFGAPIDVSGQEHRRRTPHRLAKLWFRRGFYFQLELHINYCSIIALFDYFAFFNLRIIFDLRENIFRLFNHRAFSVDNIAELR